MTLQKRIYRMLRNARWKVVGRLLRSECKTVLDIGCQEMFYYDRMKKKYDVTLADYEPLHPNIKEEDVQNLSFKDKSFDIVLCQEVLEHVPNPVQAMKELKRVAKKQLIISVPFEPYFTLFRGLSWEKEHFWAVTPAILKFHLGKPKFERTMVFRRYYVVVWEF